MKRKENGDSNGKLKMFGFVPEHLHADPRSKTSA
jgi:hypothetical protein